MECVPAEVLLGEREKKMAVHVLENSGNRASLDALISHYPDRCIVPIASEAAPVLQATAGSSDDRHCSGKTRV